MEDRREFTPASHPEGAPPTLIVTVDTEEAFDWSRFARENRDVSNVQEQWRAQEIFDRFGATPLYVVDHPVATDDRAVGWLRETQESGRCEIGAHLHPWVNPPFAEDVNARNSYACNLPAGLERAKLQRLTETIEDAFGARPAAYRAGRYGFSRRSAATLKRLGYTLDLSAAPHSSFAADGGPDFHNWPDLPVWLDEPGGLLQFPVTTGLRGALSKVSGRLPRFLDDRRALLLRAPGALARSGLLERVRLTPEGVDFEATKRLLRALMARGDRLYVLSYHSSSLEVGGSPYSGTAPERDRILQRLDRTLAFFRNELGGRFASASEAEAAYRAEAEKRAA